MATTSRPSRSRRPKAVPDLPPGPDPLAVSVRQAVGELDLRPEDVAVAALAVEYAETIDRAAVLAQLAADVPYDDDTAAMVSRLKQRVDAHAVMADVGPKLLAALDALGATPKARAAAGRPAPAAGKSRLAAFREEGA